MKIIKTGVTGKSILPLYLENQIRSEVIDPKTQVK